MSFGTISRRSYITVLPRPSEGAQQRTLTSSPTFVHSGTSIAISKGKVRDGTSSFNYTGMLWGLVLDWQSYGMRLIMCSSL